MQGNVALGAAGMVLIWLVYMIAFAVRLDPRRLRAHAEARRAYVRHRHGWDPGLDQTIRQMRTVALVSMALVTLLALASILVLVSGVLDTA